MGLNISTFSNRPQVNNNFPFALDAINVDGYEKQICYVYTASGENRIFTRQQYYNNGNRPFSSWIELPSGNMLSSVINSISAASVTYTTDLDSLALGFYGFNFWINASGTKGSGVPSVTTLGVLLHLQLASNSYIQVILGQEYLASRTRPSMDSTWTNWKYISIEAMPT